MISTPDWRRIITTSLLATAGALAVMLGFSALLMAISIAGLVVIVMLAMDPLRLARIILQGLVLVGPVSLVLLPVLTLLCHRWTGMLRWILLLAGPLAGSGWGAALGVWWLEDNSRAALLAILGMIGGLIAAVVFVWRILRPAEMLTITDG